MENTYLTEEDIDDIVKSGYTIRPFEMIRKGQKLYALDSGKFSGYFILIYIIEIVFRIIPIGYYLYDYLLEPVFTAGFYIVSFDRLDNQKSQFSRFFDGFKHSFNLIIANLIAALPYFLLSSYYLYQYSDYYLNSFNNFNFSVFSDLFFNYRNFYSPFYFGMAAFNVFYLPFFMFTPCFIIGYNYSLNDALKANIKIAKPVYLKLVALMAMIFVLNFIGSLVFFIGYCITVPIAKCAIFSAFNEIIKRDDGFDKLVQSIGSETEETDF